MEYLKDFFNTEDNIREYFKNTTFKFEFLSSSIVTYKTVIPIFIEDFMYDFKVSFKYVLSNDLFTYEQGDRLFQEMTLLRLNVVLELENETELYKKQKDV